MKSAKKLFAVLEILCREGEAGVTELNNKLGFGKSSIHRFLSVLRELGYAQKNSQNGKYFPTLKAFQIGALVRGRMRLVDLARPYMEKLGRATNETINLGLFDEDEVVYIDKVECVEALRIDLAVGRRVPAYCTALGKVFLANLPEEELDRYCQQNIFKAFTSRTITSIQDLRKDLNTVKKRGLAVDNGELDNGIRCIAAPINNESGEVIAAISIAQPSLRFTSKNDKLFRKLIINISQEISQCLS